MTNEEAVKLLKDGQLADSEVEAEKFNKAYNMALKALEQNVKLKEAIEKMDKWVHSGNRGDCDYFIVDRVEEIINGLKKDGTVSE